MLTAVFICIIYGIWSGMNFIENMYFLAIVTKCNGLPDSYLKWAAAGCIYSFSLFTGSLFSSWSHVDSSLTFTKTYTRLSILNLNEEKKNQSKVASFILNPREWGKKHYLFFKFLCLKYISQKFTVFLSWFYSGFYENFQLFLKEHFPKHHLCHDILLTSNSYLLTLLYFLNSTYLYVMLDLVTCLFCFLLYL